MKTVFALVLAAALLAIAYCGRDSNSMEDNNQMNRMMNDQMYRTMPYYPMMMRQKRGANYRTMEGSGMSSNSNDQMRMMDMGYYPYYSNQMMYNGRAMPMMNTMPMNQNRN